MLNNTANTPGQSPQPSTASEALEAMRNSGRCSPDEFNEWLLRLHEHFAKRWVSDNARIWQTGAIFIPVALAAFVPLTALKGPVLWWHIVVLGLPSTGLLWLWLLVAENHRAFQQKSEAWLFAIEEARGFYSRHAPNKFPSAGQHPYVFPRAVQKAIWVLPFAVGTMWVLLFVFTAAGLLK
jgi:hypothetical protein